MNIFYLFQHDDVRSMASVSESLRPTDEKKAPNSLLELPCPSLKKVSFSLQVLWHCASTSTSVVKKKNNFLVNNVSRALVSRLKVEFVGENLQDTNVFDLFKLYEDLFLPKEERENMLLEGIRSEDLRKIRSNSGDKKPKYK